VAEDERRRSDNRGFQDWRRYEPRLALRRVQSAILALGIITVVGVLGYMVFEGWSFTDALYMTVITLTTVGYREVHVLDASGQLWTMLLLITGVGTLFYAAVSSVELVVEGTVRGYFGRRRFDHRRAHHRRAQDRGENRRDNPRRPHHRRQLRHHASGRGSSERR
jgi:hypothetical protein